ncbi:hypothetical protein RA272_30910, partial [Pseudomonas syringae pv. tagetis]|uniref:hypothetical protein n=1 Tax=Pseudomonas syringae group genomosp. 7 TaxID=251699 RepID=UPI00376FF3DF
DIWCSDIYIYLGARQATQGRWHKLETNYRSSHAMVESVKHVFTQAEQREQGRGGFLFREDQGNQVTYSDALAQVRKE